MGERLSAVGMEDRAIFEEEAGERALPPCGELPLVGVEPWGTEALAKIALDHAPDVGMTAPAWMLGAHVDALDLADVHQRRALVATVALAAFVLAPDLGRSPYRAWSRDEPRPPAEARTRAQAVALTPVVPWRLLRGGPRWEVAPLVEVGQPWWAEAVDLAQVGGVAGPPRPGGLLLGRLVPVDGGARAVGALCLPAAPPPEVAARWVAQVARRLLAVNPALRREEVLRIGGHHLVALAHRWYCGP